MCGISLSNTHTPSAMIMASMAISLCKLVFYVANRTPLTVRQAGTDSRIAENKKSSTRFFCKPNNCMDGLLPQLSNS